MKLQDLHILMTVIQSGSMRKAAQSLSITQPAISRSVAELEHGLGVRLLERHRQGIEATDYGRALVDCGVAVFDELRQGVKNIEFLADPTAGEVIGCLGAIHASFFTSCPQGLTSCIAN
jgi:DNA-binding transcriptional LysR family regulator